jgi:short-subunit dehydrogenase
MAYNAKISQWQGKSVWLIGASSGIGEALAKDLSAQGARVILSARSANKLMALSTRLLGSIAVPFDFTDRGQTQAAWQAVSLAAGCPDVVVINAGTYVAMPAKHFDVDGALHQFAVNIGGPLEVLAHVLPAYIAAGTGHIVFVSSVAGYRGLPRALAYGASKSALTYMAESLYIELAHRGIGVSVVCPGFVSTSLTADNNFNMPALQTPEQASTAILKGLAKGEFEIHFPKRFTLFLKLLGYLPRWAYFWLVRKVA